MSQAAGAIGIIATETRTESPSSLGLWLSNDFIRRCSGSIVIKSTVAVPGHRCERDAY